MSLTAYDLLRRTGSTGRVHLVPSAVSLHPEMPELRNDLWWVDVAVADTVRLHNTTTQHFVDLQPTDVVATEADPHAPQGGLAYLRVRLARQLWMQRNEVGWVTPLAAV